MLSFRPLIVVAVALAPYAPDAVVIDNVGPARWTGVVARAVTSKTKAQPFRNHGAFTFTLRNTSGAWKITSQTWTATPINE